MAWLIFCGALAAWGLLCGLWAAFGWLLESGSPDIFLVCPENTHPEDFLPRFRWLRSLGLVRGQIHVVCPVLPQGETETLMKKYSDIEFCSREALNARLGTERTS